MTAQFGIRMFTGINMIYGNWDKESREFLDDIIKTSKESENVLFVSGFSSIVSSCPPKHNERFVNHNLPDAKRPPLEGEASLHVSGIIEGIFVAL